MAEAWIPRVRWNGVIDTSMVEHRFEERSTISFETRFRTAVACFSVIVSPPRIYKLQWYVTTLERRY